MARRIQADAEVTFAAAGHDQVINATKRVGDQFSRTSRQVNNTTKVMHQQFRFMRGGLGQLGYQIQDVAVQLQMGQNAMLVFGQQGSQVASLFGPQGALIGAVLAVGAAIATAFARDVEKGKDELKSFVEQAREVAKESERISAALQAFLLKDAQQEYNRLAQETAGYKIELREAEEALASLQGQQNFFTGGSFTVLQALQANKKGHQQITREIAAQEKALVDLNAQVELSNQKAKEQLDIYAALLKGENPYKKAAEDNAEALAMEEGLQQLRKQTREQIWAQLDADRKSEREMRQQSITELEDALKRETELEQKRLEEAKQFREENLSHMMDVMKREDEARAAREEKERLFVETKKRLDSAMVASALGAVDLLLSGMDRESAGYKAAFAVRQGLAIAQTIMSAESAAAAAMAPPPIGLGPVAGLPYSNLIRTLGYASAGIIAGQTFASFDGGGFTRNGARSGGMDGKGGMLAMLHPNEKVTDLTRSDSAPPVNISFNIQANDAAGFDELLMRRRGMIVSMVNRAMNERGKRGVVV